MEEFARENMGAFLARHFSGFGNFDTMLATGIPYREIIGKAREVAADLIVIGTHGRTGVEHVIFSRREELPYEHDHGRARSTGAGLPG